METFEYFPASLLKSGDWYIDPDDQHKYLATVVTRAANRWFVEVLRGDSTVRRYFHSEPLRIVV